MKEVQEALRERHIPAIRLKQVDDSYYVVDGHHRVGIAYERGMSEIDAIVTCRC